MAGTFAFGTTLTLGTSVTNLTNIGGPSMSADTIDVTDHSSANRYREFVQGLRDGGEVSVEGNFVYAQAVKVYNAFESNDVQSDAVIEFPNGNKITFDCIVTSFKPSAPHDDKIAYSATLKVSGRPVLSET